MNKIERVYILGLGAIGGSFAAKLSDVQPKLVTIIADEHRIETLKGSNLTINGKTYDFKYACPDDELPPADLIIIAVKYPQLTKAIQDINKFVGKQTIVMSFLNGISSEDLIGDAIGMEHMLYSYVFMEATRKDFAINYSDWGKVVFGEKKNYTWSPKVSAVKDLFDKAGIPYQIPEDMMRALWRKFMLNVGVNQTSAMLRANYGVFQKNRYAREMMIMAAKEVVALSRESGTSLNQEDIVILENAVNSFHPEGKTSMLQDVEAGRDTEVEIFAGIVIQLGKKHNIPTPINDMLYRYIKVSEQQRWHILNN